MSLAECFPHAIVKDGHVYFIRMSAFKDLTMDSSVELNMNARVSVHTSVILAELAKICVSDIGDIEHNKIDIANLLSNIPLEDKARLVFCSSFYDDNNALFNDFFEYWIDKKPHIYKNTNIRFVKDGAVVMEMNV